MRGRFVAQVFFDTRVLLGERARLQDLQKRDRDDGGAVRMSASEGVTDIARVRGIERKMG